MSKILDSRWSGPYYTQVTSTNLKNSTNFQLFLGPPGAGKSTTAQLIGHLHKYIYYEGDCFKNGCNPFIDVNVENPSLAVGYQKPLKVYTLQK